LKLLITGGAGFIGSNFIHYLSNLYPNYKIVNLDALTYAGNLESLRTVEGTPNYRFVKGSITDRSLINKILENETFDVIINFAAESHVDRSIWNPDTFIHSNIQGTQTLLDAAKQFGIKKFIQVSTDEVYGTLGENGYFTEETPLAPNSPYSASKASADLLARSYYETYNLPVNITRCSNNYGPYQFPEKLIPLMTIKALQGRELPVYGDGMNVRDWLHVEDHCQAIDLILHKGSPGEVYNIGGNNEKNNLEIVQSILKYLGKSDSMIKFVEDRPGHDKRYAIDASKLKSKLGWLPKYNFDNGIEQTIQWYLDNQDWWKNILNN